MPTIELSRSWVRQIREHAPTRKMLNGPATGAESLNSDVNHWRLNLNGAIDEARTLDIPPCPSRCESLYSRTKELVLPDKNSGQKYQFFEKRVRNGVLQTI